MNPDAAEPVANIRVAFQQPSLAAYRVPFFRELANRSGIELTLRYGDRSGLTNVAADGFHAEAVPMTRKKIGALPIYWHSAQTSVVSPEVADVAVLVWNPQYLSLLPALRLARKAGVATLLWGHGYSKREANWRRRLRYGVAGWADGVVFYDRTTADRAVERGWIPADKAFVAPNAIDGEPIDAAVAEVTEGGLGHDPVTFRRSDRVIRSLADFRRRNEIDPERTLLFVSRLHADNRLDWAVRSLAELPPGLKDVALIIVGRGNDETVRLRRLADVSGVADRVKFLGPIYAESELARWFLSCRAFVYPSNIGLSLFHAMHYGVPAVTAAVPDVQNPEFFALDPGRNGVTFDAPLDDPGGAVAVANLTAALTRLFTDDDYHRRVAAGARRHVRDRQSLSAMVDGFERAIRTVHQGRLQ